MVERVLKTPEVAHHSPTLSMCIDSHWISCLTAFALAALFSSLICCFVVLLQLFLGMSRRIPVLFQSLLILHLARSFSAETLLFSFCNPGQFSHICVRTPYSVNWSLHGNCWFALSNLWIYIFHLFLHWWSFSHLLWRLFPSSCLNIQQSLCRASENNQTHAADPEPASKPVCVSHN